MPVKKNKVKAPIKKPKPKSKPRAKAAAPKSSQIQFQLARAYEAGLKAGIPAYGSIPRTGGNYAIAQGLPQQVFASSGSVPIGSNINDNLLNAYNALVWAKEPPTKEEYASFSPETQQAYAEAIRNVLGQEARLQFEESMKEKSDPSISPLFQEQSQRGAFELETTQRINKIVSDVLSEVVKVETSDNPTTNNPFSGSAFISRIRKNPQQLPKQTSGIFQLNQIEKQDNALSNLARQSRADREDIEVSQALENQAYPETQAEPTAKPKAKERRKKN